MTQLRWILPILPAVSLVLGKTVVDSKFLVLRLEIWNVGETQTKQMHSWNRKHWSCGISSPVGVGPVPFCTGFGSCLQARRLDLSAPAGGAERGEAASR